MILLYIFYLHTAGALVLKDQSVSLAETKTAAVDTVMPPGYSLVPIKVRTHEERIEAIISNFILLDRHAQSINESFTNREKRIAYYALLAHCARVLRAIDDLVKKEVREDKRVALTMKVWTLRWQVEAFKVYLTTTVERIIAKRPQPSGENRLPVAIAGGGPAGSATGVAFLGHEEFKGRVVVVSDKYAEFPTRSGSLADNAMEEYLSVLGISASSYQKLQIFFTVREHISLSIKHLDIAGRAIYLADGGEIIQGRVDSYDQLSLSKDKQHLDLTLNIEGGARGKTIFNLSCMIITTGYKAFYPHGIKREQLPSAPRQERIKNVQVNVLVSASLMDNLKKLMNKFSFIGFNLNEKQIEGQPPFFIKVQFFLFLTVKENGVLEDVVSQYSLSAEQKILLKLKLYVDFLNKGALNWSELMLRDQIKSGKHLCYEYEGPQATAPDQKIVALSAHTATFARDSGQTDFKSTTKTVMAWAGAAAMPPSMIYGLFAGRAATQGMEIANQLVETNFAEGEHSARIKDHFDRVRQEAIKDIAWRNQHPDQSEPLKTFLSPLMRNDRM